MHFKFGSEYIKNQTTFLCEKIHICGKSGEELLWSTENCLFLQRQKNVFFSRILCANIECLDVHPDIIFRIFEHFEICFLDNECIYTYEPK